MNDIVKVQFTFENCESLTYEASDIAKIELYGITEQFAANSKKISRRRYVSAFDIILKGKAKPFGINLFSATDNPNDRFKECDVAQIIFIYEDGTNELYQVEWPESDTYTHSRQTFSNTLAGNIQFNSYVKKKHAKKFTSLEHADYYC